MHIGEITPARVAESSRAPGGRNRFSRAANSHCRARSDLEGFQSRRARECLRHLGIADDQERLATLIEQRRTAEISSFPSDRGDRKDLRFVSESSSIKSAATPRRARRHDGSSTLRHSNRLACRRRGTASFSVAGSSGARKRRLSKLLPFAIAFQQDLRSGRHRAGRSGSRRAARLRHDPLVARADLEAVAARVWGIAHADDRALRIRARRGTIEALSSSAISTGASTTESSSGHAASATHPDSAPDCKSLTSTISSGEGGGVFPRCCVRNHLGRRHQPAPEIRSIPTGRAASIASRRPDPAVQVRYCANHRSSASVRGFCPMEMMPERASWPTSGTVAFASSSACSQASAALHRGADVEQDHRALLACARHLVADLRRRGAKTSRRGAGARGSATAEARCSPAGCAA